MAARKQNSGKAHSSIGGAKALARRFGKLLVANRGEIACRVIRTARRMGLKTVAVCSQADHNALHVEMADEAVLIGPAPATESYLRIDKVIDAARATGAEAIHPGYGFLSENEEFARACAEEALVFIGPTPEAIHAMASKAAARALMAQAGVPIVPGYHGAKQDDATLVAAAKEIGFPVLIKPSAGGGGKGMRIVNTAAELGEALQGARREAARSFGDESLVLEKYVTRPRHIEVQVFGDTHGQIVSIFERDCTLQRRYQKVIEEAPAASLSGERRAFLHEAARAAARAIGYVGAGTVEFIASERDLYFLEMNTRLQVEHPVTEMITGLDLVEWQIRVAAGEPLPLGEDEIRFDGHAIEARLYAEDPDRGLLPSTGKITHWSEPEASADMRVDTGFRAGDTVTQHYDPMLAKLIVKAPDRAAALRRLDAALSEFEIAGVATNISLLRTLAQHGEVGRGAFDTNFIGTYLDNAAMPAASPADLAAACAALLIREQRDARSAASSPWSRRDGWMMAGRRRRALTFLRGDTKYEAALVYARGGLEIEIGGETAGFSVEAREGTAFDAFLAGRKRRARGVWNGPTLVLSTESATLSLVLVDPYEAGDMEAAGHHGLTAPMSGTVTRIIAAPGKLERGAPILVIESMKMEHMVRARAPGTLNAIRCAVGDFVQQGAELADFEAGDAT